jgi:hypothetical protein
MLACHSGAVAEEAPAVEENLPLHTHDLQLDPGCYVPSRPTSDSSSTGLDGGTGDMMSQMSEFQEMNMSLNMQYQLQFMMLFNQLIQSDPTADSWEFEQHNLDGQGFHVRIEPLSRVERISHFQIQWERTIPVYNGPIGSAPQLVETSSTGYGTATPHTTTVEVGATVFRWSDNAWELRTVEPVGVYENETWEIRWEAVSMLRGCDPNTLVSFGSSPRGTFECWSLSGFATDCERVDLWP